MPEFSNPFIKTKEFKKYVITNETYLKPYEKTYIIQLINAINFKHKTFNTVEFLTVTKMKKKRSHKQEAKWYFKLFEELGAKYKQLSNLEKKGVKSLKYLRTASIRSEN